MLTSARRLVRLPSTAGGSDVLAAAAHLAATSTGAPIGVVWMRAAGTVVWRGAHGATRGLPSADGFASRVVVPALAGAAGAPRSLTRLSDHPDLHGVVGESVDGLVSGSTSLIRPPSGDAVGLVGAFDTVPREWAAELDQLDLIAGLLSQSSHHVGLATATRLVAATVGALEQSLGGDALEAVLDSAAQSQDARLRRRASQAQRNIEDVAVLRGRLREVLRTTPFADSGVGVFDLVTTTERAVAEVCRTNAVMVPVAQSESMIPVWGDAREAHVAIVRAVTAAFDAVHPADLSIGCSTRATGADSQDRCDVGEVSVRARGAAMAVNDLSSIVAAFSTQAAGAHQEPSVVSLRVDRGETRLTAPGFEATAADSGTWVTLRWPSGMG